MENRNYLPHIDGLRAIAILPVLLFHFNEEFLPGGYLGVDLFFVISGYVITGYLLRSDPVSKRAYFLDFYVKRFKRLIPALLACTILTSMAFVLLTTRPSTDIFKTGALALFGMSNNYLFWRSTDYFSLDASLNPFTHTWSLGVEEQFYLFYPMVLLLLGLIRPISSSPKRYLGILLGFICISSFIGFCYYFSANKSAAFYLFPFRIWELSLGCAAFFLQKQYHHFTNNTPSWISSAALFCLCACFFIPQTYQLISTPILALLAIPVILDQTPKSISRQALSIPILVWIGLLSYSLYIWHWPILVLAKHTIGSSFYASMVTILVVIVFSVSSYYLLERPLRYKKFFNQKWKEATAYFLVISFIGVLLAFEVPKHKISENNLLASSFNIDSVDAWGDEVDCHGKPDLELKVDPVVDCLAVRRTSANPNVLYLLGDSHAAQLYFMFERVLISTKYQLRFIDDGSIVDLTKSSGLPAAFDFVLEGLMPGDIVAIAFHRGHFNSRRDVHINIRQDVRANEKTELFLNNFALFNSAVINKGAKVLLMRDTPLMGKIITSPSCKLQIKLFGKSDCQVSMVQDLHTRKRQDYVFDILLDQYEYNCSWDPLPFIYRGKSHFDVVNERGEYLMLDWNHISRVESERLAEFFEPSFRACVRITLTSIED